MTADVNEKSVCTCELETGFLVAPEYENEYPYPESGFAVIDAECVTLAVCKHEKYANLICWALNKLDDLEYDRSRYTVCPEHWRGPRVLKT